MVATMFSVKNHTKNNLLVMPKIFYEKNIITRFDNAGNPFGTSTLFRKDGVSGKPQKVLNKPKEHQLDSVTSSYGVEDGKLVQTITSDSGTVSTVAYDFFGTKQGETKAYFILPSFPASLTNSERTAKAVTSEQCTKLVAEGPCPKTFSLAIEKPVGFTVKTLYSADIPGTESGNFYALPIAFSKDGLKLFLFVSQFGDSLNPSSFDEVDLHTFAVTQLLAANIPVDANVQSIEGLNFIRKSADGTALFVEKTFGDPQKSNQLLKITLEPWSVQSVATVPEGVQAQELKPDDTGVVQQKSDGGFSLIGFSTGASTALATQGYFLQWSHDGAYYLYRVLDDNHNGLGSYKLMVGSVASGKKTEIVRQTVTAQSVGTTTKIGDILYAPVGIW